MASYVGPELDDEHRAICMYTGSRPGELECLQSAVVHIIGTDGQFEGYIGLQACQRHADMARAAPGSFVMEHPFDGECGLPGTIWNFDENRCVLDDSGVEPTARVAAAVCV
jgi:hypothetical protein